MALQASFTDTELLRWLEYIQAYLASINVSVYALRFDGEDEEITDYHLIAPEEHEAFFQESGDVNPNSAGTESFAPSVLARYESEQFIPVDEGSLSGRVGNNLFGFSLLVVLQDSIAEDRLDGDGDPTPAQNFFMSEAARFAGKLKSTIRDLVLGNIAFPGYGGTLPDTFNCIRWIGIGRPDLHVSYVGYRIFFQTLTLVK